MSFDYHLLSFARIPMRRHSRSGLSPAPLCGHAIAPKTRQAATPKTRHAIAPKTIYTILADPMWRYAQKSRALWRSEPPKFKAAQNSKKRPKKQSYSH
jgi:hypothetical protein